MSLHPAFLPTRREPRPAGAASIGELNERSLHRALKARYAVGGGATEQAVDGFVADVVAGGRIVEVHTGSFRSLKRKLPRLLDRYPVTLVHPLGAVIDTRLPIAPGRSPVSAVSRAWRPARRLFAASQPLHRRPAVAAAA